MINDAANDERFRAHPGLEMYGINSYIAVPLRWPGGETFGTLCALDPSASDISDQNLGIFSLLAELITLQLAAEDRAAVQEKELARAREEAEAREMLIGVLGHDLRAPLTAIKASAQFAKRSVDDTPMVEVMLDGIESSVTRMHRMIADLLDFTRGRLGGGIPIEKRPADLSTICRVVVDELRRGNVDARIEMTVTESVRMKCDPDRLAQVVSNLVSNALQYRERETPVRVDLCSDSIMAALRISNVGSPIPEETREKLFGPFRRGAHAAPTEGLGLGLFISREIVAAHGGAIEVSSSDGWNHFDVRLPREDR